MVSFLCTERGDYNKQFYTPVQAEIESVTPFTDNQGSGFTITYNTPKQGTEIKSIYSSENIQVSVVKESKAAMTLIDTQYTADNANHYYLIKSVTVPQMPYSRN